jgi:hypothetical protein
MPLILVLHLEEWTAILDGELCDGCNCPEDLAVLPDVVAVHLLEDPPHLEVPVDGLMTRPARDCIPLFMTGLHGFWGHLTLLAALT